MSDAHVVPPEDDILTRDRDGVVHYVRNLARYDAQYEARFGSNTIIYGEYCAMNTMYKRLWVEHGHVVTCLQCLGLARC